MEGRSRDRKLPWISWYSINILPHKITSNACSQSCIKYSIYKLQRIKLSWPLFDRISLYGLNCNAKRPAPFIAATKHPLYQNYGSNRQHKSCYPEALSTTIGIAKNRRRGSRSLSRRSKRRWARNRTSNRSDLGSSLG
jgi:hypothetical protein